MKKEDKQYISRYEKKLILLNIKEKEDYNQFLDYYLKVGKKN